jgi:hypothetical protein
MLQAWKMTSTSMPGQERKTDSDLRELTRKETDELTLHNDFCPERAPLRPHKLTIEEFSHKKRNAVRAQQRMKKCIAGTLVFVMVSTLLGLIFHYVIIPLEIESALRSARINLLSLNVTTSNTNTVATGYDLEGSLFVTNVPTRGEISAATWVLGLGGEHGDGLVLLDLPSISLAHQGYADPQDKKGELGVVMEIAKQPIIITPASYADIDKSLKKLKVLLLSIDSLSRAKSKRRNTPVEAFSASAAGVRVVPYIGRARLPSQTSSFHDLRVYVEPNITQSIQMCAL